MSKKAGWNGLAIESKVTQYYDMTGKWYTSACKRWKRKVFFIKVAQFGNGGSSPLIIAKHCGVEQSGSSLVS